MNANTVPLDEALPWSPSIPRTILVCDSIETDGRFVLYTIATQILKSKQGGRVLWLTGSPVTDRQVAMALKKSGCDVAAAYLRDASKSQNLKIQSLAAEVAATTLLLSLEDADDKEFHAETFLKQIYKQVKTWLQEGEGSDDGLSWVLLDDVSSLAAILGEKIVFCFIDSLNALAMRWQDNTNAFGIVIRCSHDLDQTLHKRATNIDEEKDQTGWMGAGGLGHKQQLKHNQQDWIPWERSLNESVDAIVDVVPLTSGYSREAHGRLIFSECPSGRGWGKQQPQKNNTSWNELVINYCLHDNGVRAIRLRGTSSMA
jgi:hypothetical protein